MHQDPELDQRVATRLGIAEPSDTFAIARALANIGGLREPGRPETAELLRRFALTAQAFLDWPNAYMDVGAEAGHYILDVCDLLAQVSETEAARAASDLGLSAPDPPNLPGRPLQSQMELALYDALWGLAADLALALAPIAPYQPL